MARDLLIHKGKMTTDLDADHHTILNVEGIAVLVNGKVPASQLPDVGGKFIVVDALPDASAADPKAIYLVPKSPAQTRNVYDEYVRVEPTEGTYAWEKIGDTEIDLSNYATKADATLTPTYGDPNNATWTIAYPQGWEHGDVGVRWNGDVEPYCWTMHCDVVEISSSQDPNAATLSEEIFGETITATRTDVVGYYLGSDNTKILTAKEAMDALAAAVAAKYTKPSGGIPATDLAAAVQTSLGKADTALQAHQQLGVGAEALHWEISSAATDLTIDWDTSGGKWVLKQNGVIACYEGEGNAESLSLFWAAADNTLGVDVTATRQMAGWVLGTQSDKPLATAAQGALALTAVQPSALPASETWTFEVDDGQGGTTTVTKSMAIYAGGNS